MGYFGGSAVLVGGPLVGGTDKRVLFDDAGAVGEDAEFTYDKTTNALTIGGSAGAASSITYGGTSIVAEGAAADAAETSLIFANTNAVDGAFLFDVNAASRPSLSGNGAILVLHGGLVFSDTADATIKMFLPSGTNGVNIGDGNTPSARLHVRALSGTTKGQIIDSGTSTGNILEVQDNATAVFTIADGGGCFLQRSVEANTGTKAPAATESFEMYTNEGDADGSIINLPGAAAGLTYTVYVQTAQTITVNAAAGDTIRIAASVSAAAGNAASNTVGNCLTLVAINATEWVATAVVGTWTLT